MHTSRENQVSFAGLGVADFPAQGNDPACQEPMCNIARICAAMTNVSLGGEVERLARVRAKQQQRRRAAAVAEPPPPRAVGETPTPVYIYIYIYI